MVKYLSFHNSSFALRYIFKVNGKATMWHTPPPLVSTYLEPPPFQSYALKLRKRYSPSLVEFSSMGDISFTTTKFGLLWAYTYMIKSKSHVGSSMKCSHFLWTFMLFWLEMCFALEKKNVPCVENKACSQRMLLWINYYIFSIQLSLYENPPPHPPNLFLSCVYKNSRWVFCVIKSTLPQS